MNLSAGVNNSNGQPSRKTHNQNIQAYVRVRPLNARERCIRSSEVVDVVSPREIITRHSVDSKQTKKFTFDRTFGPDSRQVDVYSTVVAPLIEEVLSGYNCTVFAYGQTGTGKTHTMIGTECAELKSSWEDDSDIGIIPRALSHLFDELRLMEMEFSMRISYLELYNEELCDLLSTDDSLKIRIFDDSTKKGSVIIQGLEEIPVHSKDDVYKLLEKGKERRKTASTLMNAQSSRSHTVFSILVHIRENGIDGEEMLKIGKLNLVDLAGSENVSKAGNEKRIRVRETVNINQSLLTLGRVITALVERTPHVPYRESKLTRLLQESLGGRTKTSIIATVSPGHKDVEETLSTLEYAHRAKHIQNKPEVNQKLTKKTVLKEYTEEIDKLKRDLMAARDKNGIYLAEETYVEMTLKMDSQNRELNEKMLLLKALKDELQNKERIFNEVSLHLVEKTEELKRKDQHLVRTKGELFQTKKVLNTTKRRYKEKKVLLESHVKTEQALTTQASQILAAADTAANDTEQLLNTIERRKDVDRKIQNVCERFAERMHDNFEMMDESLERFQEQHKSFAQMLIDDFASSTTLQGKLLSAANEKIQHANALCSSSLANINVTCEQHAKQLTELSGEHKMQQEKILLELKRSELQSTIQQIHESLQDVQSYHDNQRQSFDQMRASVVSALKQSTVDVQTHAAQLQQQLTATVRMSEVNLQKLATLSQAIENERAVAVQEQQIIDEFVAKMQTLKEQRASGCSAMSVATNELRTDTKTIIAQLQEAHKQAQAFEQKRCADNVLVQHEQEQQMDTMVQLVDQDVAKCASIKIQLDNLHVGANKRVDALHSKSAEWHDSMQQQCSEHEASVKRLRLQTDSDMGAAFASIDKGLNEDCQRLKGNITVGIEFTNSLESQVRDYTKRHTEQVGQCSRDVNEFKQNEMKMYAPTGATPSKRDFVYPRVLAATSPHTQIVRRVRQENDWSDLDTTATIDEGSELEADEEERSAVIELSDTETILNSTPVDGGRNNSNRKNNSKNMGSNSNLLQVNSRNSSLSKSLTPRKGNTSPIYLKANKENVA